jgi:hypothetical protein
MTMSAERFARSFFASATVAIALVAVSPELAAESEQFSIAVPSDWEAQPGLADDLATLLATAVTLGGIEKDAGAKAYVKAGTGGLYVSWLWAQAPAEEAETIIRQSLDALRSSVKASDADEIDEIEYNERRRGQVIDARMAWRHRGNQTVAVSRTFMWLSAKRELRLLRGECVFAEPESDDDPAPEICRRALSTLVARELREAGAEPLAELGTVAEPEAAAGEGPAPAATADGEAGEQGPTIGPAGQLYQSPDRPASNRKNLWIFLAGAALILFAFYSTARSRRAGARPEEGAAADADADEGASAAEREPASEGDEAGGDDGEAADEADEDEEDEQGEDEQDDEEQAAQDDENDEAPEDDEEVKA